jgi:hypothetical protein
MSIIGNIKALFGAKPAKPAQEAEPKEAPTPTVVTPKDTPGDDSSKPAS